LAKSIFGSPIFGKSQYLTNYLAKLNIWQNSISGKSQYLAEANIWQQPILGKSQYLAKANIWSFRIISTMGLFPLHQVDPGLQDCGLGSQSPKRGCRRSLVFFSMESSHQAFQPFTLI
jgi:hypothetical protein